MAAVLDLDDSISNWHALTDAERNALVAQARERTTAENVAAQKAEIREHAEKAAAKLAKPDEFDVPTIALWLRSHIADIARCDWASEMLDEITAANNEMTRLIDTPPSRIYVGTCQGTGRIGPDGTPDSVDTESEPCGSDLYVHEDDRHHLATVRCGVCGSTYSLAARQEWVRLQYLGKLVTVSDGSVLLGIKKDTIKSWVRRKRIHAIPSGVDQAVYLVDELIELDRSRKINDAA